MLREKKKDGTTVLSGLTLNDIMLALNPVGKIYISVDPTDPGELFGGTWVSWGSGRVPVGVDDSQTEFDVVEETGGEKTHTLTTSELPAHNHSLALGLYGTAGAGGTSSDNGGGSVVQGTASGRFDKTIILRPPVAITGGGSGDAHNNLQPYITCYMWKRTA